MSSWKFLFAIRSPIRLLLQWPAAWPGPADKNPNTYTYNIYTPTATLPEVTNLPETNNDHLVEKIAIPVGTVTGTGLLTGLTYYYCKKKKKKLLKLKDTNSPSAINKAELSEGVELIKLVDKELPVIQEISANTTKVEVLEENNNELTTLTPPSSPLPQRAPQLLEELDPKELLLTQLRTKLVGNEQLWSNYCEAQQLLASNPTSKFLLDIFNNYQNQLLNFLTLSEIMMLLENNHVYANTNQTDYLAQIEVRSPQLLSYGNPQAWI